MTLNRQAKENKMITDELKLAKIGKDLWYEYVKLNGYSFDVNQEGLKKLSKILNLNISYMRKCINLYLES